MKKVRKVILAAVAAVIILVAAAVIWIDVIAKKGTEAGATFALGTKTTLNSADIGLVSGRSELQTLQVNNPPGFDTSHFLKLDKAAVAVSLGSLTGDTVEVPEFTLEGIDVNIEKKGGSSNYQVILDNLKKFESKSDTSAEKPAKEETGKKFVIREILIKNVTAHVKLAPLPEVAINVPEIRLKNVGTGSDKGVMIAELTNALLKAIMMAIAEQGGNLLPKEILGELNTALAGLAPLKDIGATLAVNIGGTLKDIGGQAGQAVQAVTEEASKAVQGAADQAAKTVQAATQEASKTVEDAAKKATDDVAGKIGDLLKPAEKKDK